MGVYHFWGLGSGADPAFLIGVGWGGVCVCVCVGGGGVQDKKGTIT